MSINEAGAEIFHAMTKARLVNVSRASVVGTRSAAVQGFIRELFDEGMILEAADSLGPPIVKEPH